MSRHSGLVKATLLSALLAAGCADEVTPPAPAANPFDTNAAFVAVPRSDAAAARRARVARKLPPAQGNQDFYLAIKKTELARRYFLAATIEQSFPGGFNDGLADLSLEARVVTFRVQNDKLFVFDAGDGNSPSTTFDPEVLIEAYPIVQAQAYGQSEGAEKYVVFDPAAGLNRFSVVSDQFAAGKEPNRFQIEISYLQRFRQLQDGIAFQQVFTGYAENPFQAGPIQVNAFQSSGTLAISLRSYKEGPGFQPVFDDERDLPTHYFTGRPQFVQNEGRTHAALARWNIKPGMTPIRWLISRELVDFVAANPEAYAGVDVVGAVRKGIESWNAAFGFKVLETRIAAAGDSFADEEKNFVTFDPDPTAQFALATFRLNPNTGETRSGEVYLPSVFVDISFFSDDPPAAVAAPQASPRVTWDALTPHVLCARDAAFLRAELAAAPGLSAGQKLERFVQHVMAHEIGHVLGLRHNFKGSLVPPSTSIMDYLRDPLAIATPRPGSYDVDAVRFLYGLATVPPAQPFCTDEDLEFDPLCAQKDNGTDPLVDYWAPRFVRAVNGVFDDPEFTDAQFDDLSQGVLSFVRAGEGNDPLRAWELAMLDLRAPISPALASDPAAAAAVDRASRLVFDFLLGRGSKATTVRGAPIDPAVQSAIVADLRGNLLNLDGVRSFTTRRVVVDVLKKLQRTDAHLVLLEARAQLAGRLAAGGMTPEETSLTADLLARIDAAVDPYFE
jgi:hypothetical protein